MTKQNGGQRLPNLRHVRLLLLVSEGLTVHAAAKAMSLTQPAVTLSLVALEELYGVPLFERRLTGLSPTKYGTVLGARAARCFSYLVRAIKGVLCEADASPMKIEKLLGLLTVAQLRALGAMDKHGSFSAAAESLALRPPSIHRAIADLEASLDVGLVHREKKGATLNAAGHEVAVLFNLALEELRSAAAEIRELDGRLEGTVVVGAARVTASGILPTAILSLSDRIPAANFFVAFDQYERMLHALRAGRLDYICSTARPNIPSDFVAEHLCESELRIICRSDHPLTRRKSVTVKELAGYRWVGSPHKTGAAIRFKAMFEREGIEAPKFTARTEIFELTRSLVMSGQFLALTVRGDIGSDYEHDGLCVLKQRVPDGTRPIWLIRRKDWKPTRLHEEFSKALRDVVTRVSEEVQPAAPRLLSDARLAAIAADQLPSPSL